MSFIKELKRRNVIRMAGLYLVGAWLIIQITETLLPIFGAPDWVVRSVVILLAIGFIPALIVSWVFELTPDGLKRDGELATGEAITPKTARRLDRMLLLVMAVALGYFAVDKFVLTPAQMADEMAVSSSGSADSINSADTASAAVSNQSIAVLAFADLSPNKDNEYFSDGVADEILGALSRIDGLKVAGRTSSFYFKGRNEALAVIGSTLGVAHVLEGSVRKQGDRLRISAQLLRISDGFPLWSETFDGTDADIFALQERIAQKVTSELQVALNAGQQNRLINAGTSNPDAYALYLKATDIFNRRAQSELAAGIAAVEQAVALDPTFARAVSRLATLYSMNSGNEDAAASTAQQALRLDPTLAEPHAVLGVIDSAKGRYPQARAALEQALRVDPNDPTTNLWQAAFYCGLGYIERCEAALDRTLEIDPLLPNALAWRSRLWVSAGDLPAAEQASLRARELGLSWVAMSTSWVALAQGDLAGARSETEALVGANTLGLSPAAKAFAGARVGDAKARAEAMRFIDQYIADNPPPISSFVALVLVWSGEIERALELFATRASLSSTVFLSEVLGTRLYPQVWSSPAFPDFLRRNGIAAYWDEFGPPPHCAKNSVGDYGCE